MNNLREPFFTTPIEVIFVFVLGLGLGAVGMFLSTAWYMGWGQ